MHAPVSTPLSGKGTVLLSILHWITLAHGEAHISVIGTGTEEGKDDILMVRKHDVALNCRETR